MLFTVFRVTPSNVPLLRALFRALKESQTTRQRKSFLSEAAYFYLKYQNKASKKSSAVEKKKTNSPLIKVTHNYLLARSPHFVNRIFGTVRTEICNFWHSKFYKALRFRATKIND